MRSSLRFVGAALLLVVAVASLVEAHSHAHLHSVGESVAPSSNPRGKSHRVSKSSYHTDAGRSRDSTREYAGEGSSHVKHFSSPSRVAPELGVHLADPGVHEAVTQQFAEALGAQYAHLVPSAAAAADGTPEQVRLSLTARAGELVFSWLTWNCSGNAAASTVRIGTAPGVYDDSITGQVVTFVDPNSMHLIRYIHNVLVADLKASTTYFYVVGSAEQGGTFSPEFNTTTVGQGSQINRLAVYGDLGLVNSQSMAGVSAEVAAGTVQAVLHIGDFAYNMDELQGLTGDLFLNDLQNITSAVPLMGCAGNHEAAFNFSHYTHKFSAWNYVADASGPADSNWWFSWDMESGGVLTHYISLDSEIYYWNYYEPLASPERVQYFQQMIKDQYAWLVQDLTSAYDSGKYSWIVAYSHRPLYCSNVDDVPDCTTDAETLRIGPSGTGEYGFETAFALRPVDLYLAAHEHSYERTYPTRNGSVDWASVRSDNLYVNPAYPTHIITGSGGCREYFDFYDQVFYGPWSVIRSATYGYGHLTVYNATHLLWDQGLDEGRGGTDTLWIVKDAAGAKQQTTQAAAVEAEEEEEPLAMEVNDDDEEEAASTAAPAGTIVAPVRVADM